LPKKTTEVIIESKNDYLIGVKKNQRTLYDHLQSILQDKSKQSSSYTTLEVNKGRVEWRHIMVSNNIGAINKDWRGLQQIVAVQRKVRDKVKSSEEMAYFISSRNANALWYEEGIRSHWAIENSLHWVKDVTLKEDASKIRTGNAAQNMSTLKNMGINIFRKNDYQSIAQAMRLVANDIKLLYNLII
jgi:predicted transposase YbfD/YdcC